MDNEIKDAVTAGDTWMRALYMFLFAIIYSVAEVVLTAVVIIQFFFVLFTRDRNERLLEFGEDLSVFVFQILQFETFNTDEKPFPFGPWPYGADEDIQVIESEVTDDEGEDSDDDTDART